MKSKKIAVYPGSFDPFHIGHAHVMKEASFLFDTLYICIGQNSNKNSFLSTEEKIILIQKYIESFGIRNIEIKVMPEDITTALFANRIKATHIVRGIRSGNDVEFELNMSEVNSDLGNLKTIIVPSPQEIAHVSSSVIRDLTRYISNERQIIDYCGDTNFLKMILEREFRVIERLNEFNLNTEHTVDIWEDIIQTYLGENRYYHNLTHVRSMLKELYYFIKNCSKKYNKVHVFLFELAILFHDYVYSSKSIIPGENETDSATVLRNKLIASNWYNDPDSNLKEMPFEAIMATRHNRENILTHWEELISDLDLTILGKPEDEFMEYDSNIQKEYSHVVESKFRKGRLKVIEHFLGLDRIYFLDYFYKKYESNARTNLLRLKKLYQ